MKDFLLCLALIVLSTAWTAEAREQEVFKHLVVAPQHLDSDKAYLLLQSSRVKNGMNAIAHVMLRVPTTAETTAYLAAKQIAYDQALPRLRKAAKNGPVPTLAEFEFDYRGQVNTFGTDVGKFLLDGEMRTLLIEVPAGEYILYGASTNRYWVATCNCLGTVRFKASPGIITFIGALYADQVQGSSPLPNLEDNIAPSTNNVILGQALVPATTATPVPDSIKPLPRALAEFHAVGLFHEPGAVSINRLAPIPGVLGYERGRPIDLRTGKPAS
ncbi:MAG: hypothetical protein QM676_10480 [Novosphingobium sp.]